MQISKILLYFKQPIIITSFSSPLEHIHITQERISLSLTMHAQHISKSCATCIIHTLSYIEIHNIWHETTFAQI